jgi:hypothetical protein
MKRRRTAIIVLLAILAASLTPAFAQERLVGKALYDKLRRTSRDLVKLEGQPGLNWTPDGQGYYVFERRLQEGRPHDRGKDAALR